VTINTGATYNLGASDAVASIAGAGTLALNTYTLTIGADNTSTSLTGLITGTGNLIKQGNGTLTLGGANTGWSGTTTINGGIVSISADNNLGATPATITAASITLNGGALQATAGFALATNRGITLGSAGGGLAATGSNTFTIPGVIMGAYALTINGAGQTGMVILSGTNMYGTTSLAVGTIVNGGILSISRDNNLGATPATITAASITLNGGALQTTASFALASNRGITLGTNNGGLAATGSNTLTYAGIITDAGACAVAIAAAVAAPLRSDQGWRPQAPPYPPQLSSPNSHHQHQYPHPHPPSNALTSYQGWRYLCWWQVMVMGRGLSGLMVTAVTAPALTRH
jgi:autotransporter-associated beta strand protein